MKAFTQVKNFPANEIRLSIQFRSFVLNPHHFINQAFKFTTAFF